jgi:alkylation response protein AidB-like acyl-CoA dehydrogenase
MEFGFSDEQQLLRGTARAFLSEKAPAGRVRELLDDELGYSPELFAQMAGLGWTGLIFPEEYGGAGLGFVDLVPVLEELGRALTPVPYLSTLIAGCAIQRAGNATQRADWLGRICEGRAVATLALAEAGGWSEPAAFEVTARDVEGGFELLGTKLFVPDAHVADLLVVAARTPDRGERTVGLFLVPRETPGIRLRPLRTIDPLRRQSEVQFDRVQLPADALLGGEPDAWPIVRSVLDRALVMICAEMVGGAGKCLEDAVAYAKERVQFGKPIGANQAIQHQCADVHFAVESARSIAYYAAWAAAEDEEDAALTAAMAKANVSEAYCLASAESIQIHGGVGFSWEYDCQLHYKRARSDEAWFGDARHQRERVAQMLHL